MSMQADIAGTIIRRLNSDFDFKKETKGWLQNGICPDCGKRELFIKVDNPWVLKCGRLNKCGYATTIKSLYPDIFESFNKRFKPSQKNPNATADAYLQYARGFDINKIKGWYAQGKYWHPDADKGTATVRFYLDEAHTIYMERFVEEVILTDSVTQEKTKRKAHFKGARQGLCWTPPGMVIEDGDEIWLVEGCLDAIALMLNGIKASATLSCNTFPIKFLEQHKYKEVTWVWALDNDAAGQNGTKKHVKRMQLAGFKVTAAQVPFTQKRDWNDLHQRNELESKDLARYRYHGQLLIAQSASEKALLMYQWREQREFHFEFNKHLYWFYLNLEKYDKAVNALMDGQPEGSEAHIREQALKQSNAIVEIANCAFRFLYYQANTLTDESWYYARVEFPHKSKPVKNTFTGAQLSSASEFKKRMLSIAAGSMFTGESKQLDRILKTQLFGIKTVQTIGYIGYSKEHQCYVFNDIAIKDGQLYALNDEDFFATGKLNIKTLSQSVILTLTTDMEKYNAQWLELLIACFGSRGVVSLAFWLGALFAEQIRAEHKSYPFIEIIGEPSAGKSTLIEFLWKLLGRGDYEGFDPSKASFASRMRNFVQVSNMPVVLIESDREEERANAGRFDWDELKTAYNGRAIGSRGIKNTGNETYEPPFRGAIVISQNAEVNASEAILQRIIHLKFTRAAHTLDTKHMAERLEQYPLENVSGFMVQALKKEKEILRLFKEKTPDYEKQLIRLPDLKSVRIAKNHAQMMALVDALCLVLPLSDDDANAARGTLAEMAVERQHAINADHPVVQAFWEIYDYLNEGGEKPTLNHSRNNGIIAVSLNHFVQVANDRRQQTPAITELKRHLKTSKARKYLGQKTTNSAIHLSAQNEGRAVKCWQFSNAEASA